jgi:hypothetical protein
MLAFDPKLKWDNYLAFLELQKNPKYYTSPSTSCNNQPVNISKKDFPIIALSDISDSSGSLDSSLQATKDEGDKSSSTKRELIGC